MPTYLLSGAAGFIGARVATRLLAAGHTVIGVDEMNAAYDVRMKTYRLEGLRAQPGFRFYQTDIGDHAALEAALAAETEPVAGIINLAARAGVRQSVLDPWVYTHTNVDGTLNLLEWGRSHAVPKFVLASSSSVYGSDAPLPTPETSDSDHPLQAYAATKKAAEVLCHAYHYLYGVDVTVFRYFTVYGPAGRPDMSMFRFAQWIAEGRPLHLNGDGEQTRGFTYVEDIARGTILGLQPLGYEIINLGGHESIRINELIAMLEARLGRRAEVVRHPAHKADMLASWADVSKARRLLGWEPQIDLAHGLDALVAWYLAERAWANQIVTD
jgi:nucleoside-diphosphate-sugar epimerase